MPIRELTPDQIIAIKADSAKRFDGRTLLVYLAAPIDFTVVVAPFDRKSYIEHTERRCRGVTASQHSDLLARLLFPSFPEVEQVRRRWAAMPGKVSNQLIAEAGWTIEAARVEPLPESIRRMAETRALVAAEFGPEKGAAWVPPGGLDEAAAQALIDTEVARARGLHVEPALLWRVELLSQDLSVVMATPSTEVWLAACALDADRRKAGVSAYTAMEPYILDAVKWSQCPLGELLNRKPALLSELRSAYLELGGDGAAVLCKSL